METWDLKRVSVKVNTLKGVEMTVKEKKKNAVEMAFEVEVL